MSTSDVDSSNDGRTARRDRNRLAVLDAMLDLFSEDIDPSPDVVAARCGLSPRSVYRYFEDRDALMRAAIERQRERIFPLQLIHEIGQGDLIGRIDRFATARVRLYEAVADATRAARHRASHNDNVNRQVRASQLALRNQVERHFAQELDVLAPPQRNNTLNVVDALTQFETLDYLCFTQQTPSSIVRSMLVDALHSLLNTREGSLSQT